MLGMSRAVVVGVLVSVLVSLGLGSTSAASVAVERVVDRTFACAAGYLGGVYQVQVSAGYEQGSGTSGRLQPIASITKNMWESPYGQLAPSGFSVHRGLCSPSRVRVRLTTKRLRGGGVPALGAEAMCETPRRVLLRVRATFAGSPDVSTSRQFGFPQLNAFGRVERAAIAVATPSGTPIAYLSLTTTGRAQLFTRPTCKED
jgi:hypothetical protein